MRPVAMLLGCALIIFLLSAMLGSINDFRMEDYTELHDMTTTSDNDTIFALSNDLFGADISRVTITSNDTDDAPVPWAYASTTRLLTVNGLATNTAHRLTVTYKIDRHADYWGAGVASRVIPIMIVVGLFCVIAAAVYVATRGRED